MATRGDSPNLADRTLAGLAGALGPTVVRALGRTWRVRNATPEVWEAVRSADGPVIYAFWHGQILPLMFLFRGRSIHVLISWHRDGELTARTIRGLGYGVVRGSTTRGSVRGLANLTAKAAAGHDLAVTPDGPRGPAREVQRGIVFLARRTGCPIVPLAAAASAGRRLASWDGFLVPRAFTRIAFGVAEPIVVGGGSEIGPVVRTLKERLDALNSAVEAVVAR